MSTKSEPVSVLRLFHVSVVRVIVCPSGQLVIFDIEYWRDAERPPVKGTALIPLLGV